MASRRILVLDLGTSGPRCLAFDEGACLLGHASAPWDYQPEPAISPLSRSFEPEALWQTCCRLIQDAVSEAGVSAGRVNAVAVTSQRQGVAFLDRDGGEVYIGPNIDLRAVFEGGAIDSEMAEHVYQTTGHLPSLLFAPARLQWLQMHRPEAYDRIATVLTLADWVTWRLTGQQTSEPSLASEAGMLDISARNWCDDLLRDMGLDTYGVPLAQSGTVIAGVRHSAARDTGLAEGTPVVTAGADTQCGLLGLGIVQPSQTGVVAGWSTAVQSVTPRPVLSPRCSTWAGCFLDGSTWVAESSPGDLGHAYRWLTETVLGERPDALSELDALAASVPPGCEGVTAILGPPRMDMGRVGMRPGGLTFPVPLTHGDAGRGHVVRAWLEAIAFSIRANIEQLEELAGASSDVSVGGGMTRTATFRKMLADVLDRDVSVSPTPHVSGLGAYLCARIGLGDFASLQEAAAYVRPTLKRLEPDPLRSTEYQDYYERWLHISEQVQALDL